MLIGRSGSVENQRKTAMEMNGAQLLSRMSYSEEHMS